jgi:triacylglycerol esterase/lipase EstA (alpha/beta hydrolase family)
MRDRFSKTGLAVLAALVITAAFGSSAHAALPVDYSFLDAELASFASPGSSPPGANDWNCKPSAAHPRPVVLVHGTVENMRANWNALSPLLKNNGYCVFAFNYGAGLITNGQFYAVGPAADSSAQLAAFVDQVLSATHTAKVDIVGHSQGGMLPRHYMKFLGGASRVSSLVGLAPSNHGTTVDGFFTLTGLIPGLTGAVSNTAFPAWCPACRDQIVGSDFIRSLNAGGDTLPGIKYTVIVTRNDEVVTPYASAFLSGPAVTNITVQNGCLLDQVEHLSISYDRRALAYVLRALGSPVRVPCALGLPILGL